MLNEKKSDGYIGGKKPTAIGYWISTCNYIFLRLLTEKKIKIYIIY